MKPITKDTFARIAVFSGGAILCQRLLDPVTEHAAPIALAMIIASAAGSFVGRRRHAAFAMKIPEMPEIRPIKIGLAKCGTCAGYSSEDGGRCWRIKDQPYTSADRLAFDCEHYEDVDELAEKVATCGACRHWYRMRDGEHGDLPFDPEMEIGRCPRHDAIFPAAWNAANCEHYDPAESGPSGPPPANVFPRSTLTGRGSAMPPAHGVGFDRYGPISICGTCHRWAELETEELEELGLDPGRQAGRCKASPGANIKAWGWTSRCEHYEPHPE